KEALEKLREEMQKNAEDFDSGIEKKIPEIKEIARRALGEANEEAKAMEAMGHSWGLDQGQLQRLPAQRRIELAKRIHDQSEKFRRLAEVIGALRRAAMAEQKKKPNYAKEEIYDVELGNNIPNVLPSELVNMEDDVLIADFFRKFMERGLLQYRLRGEEKINKGSIIFCGDGSGSMGGDPEIWEKAMGL